MTQPDIYYERKASDALMHELSVGGALHWLVELARDKHLMDLQLRGYPHSAKKWATLYCGLTKFLDVFELKGRFTLDAGTHKHLESDIPWRSPLKPADLKKLKRPLHAFITARMRDVGDRFTKEGAVQAMLCTDSVDMFSVVDREAVVCFRNEAIRKAVYDQVRAPLLARLKRSPAGALDPKITGGELDLLAVDVQGRLLVIEVKRGDDLAGITWAPLQAAFYAGLFREWIRHAGEAAARASIAAMVWQRATLGLTNVDLRTLALPLDVVPVVAIGGTIHPEARKRLDPVRAALNTGESPQIEVWNVRPSVRIASRL